MPFSPVVVKDIEGVIAPEVVPPVAGAAGSAAAAAAAGPAAVGAAEPAAPAAAAAAAAAEPAGAAAPAAAAPPSDDEAEVLPCVDKASLVAMTTRDHLEGRTSYRLSEPEMPNRERIANTLKWEATFFFTDPNLFLEPAGRVSKPRREEFATKRMEQRIARWKANNESCAKTALDS